MSSINKLAAYLQPKSATTPNKFGFQREPARNTSHYSKKSVITEAIGVQQYSTPSYAEQRRRNYTENSKYIRRSAATLDINSHSNDKRRSLNFKNDLGVRRSIDYQKLNTNQEEKLLLMRQEKLGKLKNMYHLKSRMNNEDSKIKNTNLSRAKFNSIESLGKKHSSEIIRHKDHKDIYFFNKRQDFHYVSKPTQKSQRKVHKYFDFCEQISAKKYQNSQFKDTSQSEMPQTIKHDHIIGKVKSLKKFAQTPPLVPITFKRYEEQPLNYLSLQWFKESYEPRLQIFKQVSYQAFTTKKLNKGMYIGQLKLQTGQPQGIGFLFYPNGKIYQGYFKNGEKQGFGYENYPDGSYYLGNFVSGRRQGKGKFQWSNGEVYDGQWKNNKKQGSGIWKGPNNLSYVGEWHHDVIEGFGVLIEAGIRYQGEFKNFMKWGNGTIRFQNGQVYTGNFKQNIPSGLGDYYWTNHDHYHGEFINGKRHGEGVLRYSNGGVYRGEFQNDKKSGKGEQYYEDKLYYQGEFENDLRHGWGTLYCDGSILFAGYWLNNAAVDEKKGKIQTIIEQQYEKQTSKNSKMKKYQSNVTLLRNKNMIKRQNKVVLRNKSNQKQKSPSPDKPFRRACNCERHRRKSPFVV